MNISRAPCLPLPSSDNWPKSKLLLCEIYGLSICASSSVLEVVHLELLFLYLFVQDELQNIFVSYFTLDLHILGDFLLSQLGL